MSSTQYAPDGLAVVDELAMMENDYLSMESTITALDSLATKISVEGISRQHASTIVNYGDDILGPHYPLNAFTSTPSKTNLRPAMEGLFQKAQTMVWSILGSIGDLINRVLDWLMEYFSKKDVTKETETELSNWKKSVEARITAMERKLKDIQKSDVLSAEEKVSTSAKVKDLAELKTAEQAELRRRMMESYTVAARACMLEPDKVIQLLNYHVQFPDVIERIQAVVKTVESTLNVYDKTPSEETLMMVLGTTNDLTDRLNERLKTVCLSINRCKLSNIPFGYYDPERPDEYLANVRQSVLAACKTPSGKYYRDDFTYGMAEAQKRGLAITAVSAKFDKFVAKYDTLPDDLKTLSKRLRVVIKRVRTMSVGLSTEQIEIRNRLVDISRLLRRCLFAYMRLRELPSLVLRALANFANVEFATEEEIKKLLES